uniref:Solute carrier family 13 member 1 n=1 Tax=Cyprinus carpio carpio TaxID=630221 RepID=A0A8C0YJK4_CYPCA
MRWLRCSWSSLKLLIIFCTPLALLPLPLEVECAYILTLMALYWMTEVLPLSVTVHLPVASVYFKDFHLLLLGVICLAKSIKKWSLHRRIALRLVTGLGVNPGMLMLGFMVGCAFLSKWLSNTSTVAMVMPIVEAVIQQVLNASEETSKDHKGALNGISKPARYIEAQCDQSEKIKSIETRIAEPVQTASEPEEPETAQNPYPYHMMCKGLSLCIAYSSSTGGLTTLSGTSTNLIFAEYIYQYYPDCTIINFGNWFVLCLPILQYKSLGPIRNPGFMPGWSSLYPGYATDATVVLLLGFTFFIIPAHKPNAHGLDNVEVMPWEISLLLGGGFALAEGTKVAELLTPLGSLPILATVTIACLIVTSITEVASNAVTMTILASLAKAIGVNPVYMLIPTALCVSFSFLLPVSNTPNAIVFTYGHLTSMDMVSPYGHVHPTLLRHWGTPLLNLDTYPDWAPVVNSTGS